MGAAALGGWRHGALHGLRAARACRSRMAPLASRIGGIAALLGLVMLAGCASYGARMHEPPDVGACRALYRDVDAIVAAAGVRDAQEAAITGFPYLRVDRLHAALRHAARDDAAFEDWVTRLQAMDRAARRHELANLPVDARAALSSRHGTREDPGRGLADCAETLRAADLGDAVARRALLAQADAPPAYLAWQRVAGLYWITRLGFARGVGDLERDLQEVFDAPALPGAGTRRRYAPPPGERLDPRQVRAILERSRRGPFALPVPDAESAERLFASFAPEITVDTTGTHDLFGALAWTSATAPEVEVGTPVVYRRIAHTLVGGQALLQLVYTIWFPERPASGPLDPLAGALDAVVWRVTLAPDGEPLVFDSIHGCGCYHQFFPTPRATPRPAPGALEEWAFAPQSLPRLARGERVTLHLATRTHYLQRIGVDEPPQPARAYGFADENALRSLPRPDGTRRGIYGPDGLVPGTERPERFLFWPMGIPSAGTMRQWGHHATAFVGRRHFDDPDLLERRFDLR